MEWRNRAVTITGGAGFLGSNLAQRLVREGARVRAVDNLERGRLEYLDPILDQIEFLKLDLRDPQAARKALAGSEVVFHFASKVGGIKVYIDRPGTILNHSLLIDQNVFSAMVEFQIPSIFYASSSHVYPEDRQQTPDSVPLIEGEAYPANPGLSYGWGKLVGEIALRGLIQEYSSLRASVARIVGAYGYNQDIALDTGSLIPVLCHRAIVAPEGAAISIWGTGRETRSYCFVDDVLEAILRSVEALECHAIVGPFNLGAEGRSTVREIAETIIRISGKKLSCSWDPTIKTELWGQAVFCSKARELLNGWGPKVSLEEGLRRTYEHISGRLGTAVTPSGVP